MSRTDWFALGCLIGQGVLGVLLLIAIHSFGSFAKSIGESSRMMANAMRFEASMHEANLMMAKRLLRHEAEGP